MNGHFLENGDYVDHDGFVIPSRVVEYLKGKFGQNALNKENVKETVKLLFAADRLADMKNVKINSKSRSITKGGKRPKNRKSNKRRSVGRHPKH
jgi:hypothetical protein